MRQHRSRSAPLLSWLPLIVILLLACALRWYRLDAQSFWHDEGNSARIAERPLALILTGAAGDIHPPGYYLCLHYWRAFTGAGEFALRSFSAWAGLMTVAFTYLLGQRLFGRATGLSAAFLAAISPFAVYYSQEARMYTLLAALSAASTYLLLRALTRDWHQLPHQRPSVLGLAQPLIAYALVSAAGLYVQYAFPFVLFVHNLIFALWWLRSARRSPHRWRWLALWVGAQAAIALLYLPWLPIALGSVTGWSAAGRDYELGPALLSVLRVLTAGTTLPASKGQTLLGAAGLLLIAGLWPARRTAGGRVVAGRGDGFRTAAAATYLLVPIGLIFAFDLYKPAWLKFLLVVLPAFHVLIARGVCRVRFPPGKTGAAGRSARRALVPAALLLAFTAASVPSLRRLYFDPAYARDDYRQIAADIATGVRPGDAIILNAPNQWEVFTYYHPTQDVHPAPYRPTAGQARAFVASMTERYERLQVLYWGDAESDPQRLIEAELAAHAYKAGDRWYGNVRLATYAVAPLPEKWSVALDARFGDEILLTGYALASETLASGEILPVTLFWQAQAPVAERYKVTVQLLDSAGRLVAQQDTEPADGLLPTTTWEVDQVLADRYGILAPAVLPPGQVTLIVGLYHIATGERLPASLSGKPAGDHLRLATIEIAP